MIVSAGTFIPGECRSGRCAEVQQLIISSKYTAGERLATALAWDRATVSFCGEIGDQLRFEIGQPLRLFREPLLLFLRRLGLEIRRRDRLAGFFKSKLRHQLRPLLFGRWEQLCVGALRFSGHALLLRDERRRFRLQLSDPLIEARGHRRRQTHLCPCGFCDLERLALFLWSASCAQCRGGAMIFRKVERIAAGEVPQLGDL
jgi:hypothetical protein